MPRTPPKGLLQPRIRWCRSSDSPVFAPRVSSPISPSNYRTPNDTNLASSGGDTSLVSDSEMCFKMGRAPGWVDGIHLDAGEHGQEDWRSFSCYSQFRDVCFFQASEQRR